MKKGKKRKIISFFPFFICNQKASRDISLLAASNKAGRKEIKILDQKTIEICKAQGGQLAAMARNYEAAKSATHKTYIENFIRQNMPSTAWIAQYRSGKER